MPVRRGRGGRAVCYLRIYIRLDSGCAAAGTAGGWFAIIS